MRYNFIDTLVIALICTAIGFIAAQNWIIKDQKVLSVNGNIAYVEMFGQLHEYEIGE